MRGYDVIVVGAGPAGISAAMMLAQSGKEILVLDRSLFPRRKVCGGGLVWNTLYRVPENVRKSCVERQCFETFIHFAETDMTFTVRRRYPLISTVRRSKFDYAMLETAIRSGVEFLGGTPFKGINIRKDTPNGNIIEVDGGGKKFFARYVIAADGAGSSVGRFLKIEDGRVLMPAIEGEIKMEDAPELVDRASAPCFDFSVIPGGYGWVFPRKNTFSIGIVRHHVLHGARLGMRSLYDKYLNWLGVDTKCALGVKGALIPLTPRRNIMHPGGVFFVGDALGWTDPLIAEGISGAIMSGMEAAQAIITANGKLPEARHYFIKAVKNGLLREHGFSRFLASIVYKCPKFRNRCFSLYGQEIADVITGIISGHRSYRWLFLWPFNYIKAVGLFPLRIFSITARQMKNK